MHLEVNNILILIYKYSLLERKKNTNFLSNVENTHWKLNPKSVVLTIGCVFCLMCPITDTVGSKSSYFSRGKKVLRCMDCCSYWGFVGITFHAVLLVYSVLKICSLSMQSLFIIRLSTSVANKSFRFLTYSAVFVEFLPPSVWKYMIKETFLW